MFSLFCPQTKIQLVFSCFFNDCIFFVISVEVFMDVRKVYLLLHLYGLVFI